MWGLEENYKWGVKCSVTRTNWGEREVWCEAPPCVQQMTN